MGGVYRTIDTAGAQAVAIKILPAAGQRRTDRLPCEAKVAASLRNPRIFEILDTGTDTR